MVEKSNPDKEDFHQQMITFLSKYGKDLDQIINETSCEYFINNLLSIEIDTILAIIDMNNIEKCNPRHIPQYSNLKSALLYEMDYLNSNGPTPLDVIGANLPAQLTKTHGAQNKYGENHSKLLEALGLVSIQGNIVELTTIGRVYHKLSCTEKKLFVQRAIFKIPIIKNIMIKSKYERVYVYDELILFLSDSTAYRRLGNVYNLIQLLYNCQPMGAELKKRLNNISKKSQTR